MPTKSEMMEFAKEIDKIVKEKHLNHIESITYFCETHSIEVEAITKLINGPLKARLASEAQSLNLIQKPKSKLPI